MIIVRIEVPQTGTDRPIEAGRIEIANTGTPAPGWGSYHAVLRDREGETHAEVPMHHRAAGAFSLVADAVRELDAVRVRDEGVR